VAAKWFLAPAGEPLADEALQLLSGFVAGRTRLLVPDLFWPELGNILWKAVRMGRISRHSATEFLAATFDRTVYDCTYVALALASNMPFLTADERLANALAARLPAFWLGVLK